MALVEETLEQVARGGAMNYDNWSIMLEPVLERINKDLKIVYTEFPPTRPYPNINHPIQLDPDTEEAHTNRDPTDEQISGLNGGTIPVTPVRNRPPVPQFIASSTSATHIPDSLPPSQVEGLENCVAHHPPLHATLQQLLDFITRTLRTSFSEHPPHTLQRFAELVLEPTRHYRTLPAWLRAVDRTVSVSSTAKIFPLPHAQPLPNSIIDSSLLNGVHRDDESNEPATGTGAGGGGILWNNTDIRNGYDERGLGSDESLGGALLTPIPWLKNGLTGETHESHTTDNDDGDMLGDPIPLDNMVPERTDRAVTQGELIRQEQEAGVVPITSGGNSRMVSQDHTLAEDDEDSESIPHARGPELVGTVDMGLVDGKPMETQTGGLRQRDMHNSSQDVGAHTDTDVNNAQNVLMNAEADTNHSQSQHSHSQSQSQTEAGTGTGSGLTQPASAMQLDSQQGSEHAAAADDDGDGDEDIILTDVDARADHNGKGIVHVHEHGATT